MSFNITRSPYTDDYQPSEIAPPTMDSNNLDFMAGQAEMTIDSTTTTTSAAMDLNTSSAQPFVQRPMDPAYMDPMMYAPNFANAPMGPTPFTSGGPTEAFANGAHSANATPTKIGSIDDLISLSQLDFKYCPEVNAVLHVGRCAECIHSGMHLPFSPDHLPGEVVAPHVDDTRINITADCDWFPGHGPRGHSFRPTIESASDAPTNVPSAPMAAHTIEPPASPSTPDAEMADSEASTANAPTVASQSAAD